MKSLNLVICATAVTATALFFQNCSPGNFSAEQTGRALDLQRSTSSSLASSNDSSASSLSAVNASSSSSQSSSVPAAPVTVTASGNSITTSSGKVLNFVNLEGLSLGSASVTGTQSSIIVNLVNAPSGRTASVKIVVDSSGMILKVIANSTQPYMCHDQNASICAQFPNATSGQMEGNCQSPILYTGALTGSVNDLKTAASAQCPSTSTTTAAAPSTSTSPSSSSSSSSAEVQCTIAYSGGGSMQTSAISAATCLAACQNNQAANPTEHLTCLYNNQIISAPVATSSSSSCGGSLPAGTVVNVLTDSSGQSNYNGIQCGQANGTAKQCSSCSAKWSYPRGSYIGAQIQCVCN